MVHVEIVGSVCRVAQYHVILSRPFIGTADSLQVPIGPENEIIENGDCKNVWNFQHILDNVASIPAIQVGVGNVIQMGIRPEELVRHVVDRKSIWPCKSLLVGDDASEIASVHAQPANVSLQMPRREKQVSNSWMDNNSPRIRNAISLQRFPVRAIQFRYFNVFRMTIQPV